MLISNLSVPIFINLIKFLIATIEYSPAEEINYT